MCQCVWNRFEVFQINRSELSMTNQLQLTNGCLAPSNDSKPQSVFNLLLENLSQFSTNREATVSILNHKTTSPIVFKALCAELELQPDSDFALKKP
jgi:hypothetical protein